MPLKLAKRGFTLAELLICLQILAVIATFTIPKLLTSQQGEQNNAKMKEVAGTLAAAYQQHTNVTGPITTAFKPGDLTPYMNYVKADTATTIDTYQGGGTVTCGTTPTTCLRLHNGSMLRWDNNYTVGGTATTNGVFFSLDPDGSAGNSKAVQIFIYYNGRISTWGQLNASAVNSANTIAPCASCDPPWVDW